MSDPNNKKVELPAIISVRDFAQIIEVSPIQIIKKLMTNGVMASINQAIDFDTAAILADEMGFEAVLKSEAAPVEDEVGKVPQWRQTIAGEDEATLTRRPPVVTILGLDIGQLLGGAVVTETVFAWPGIGRLAIDSILNRDFPVLEADVFFIAVAFVGINLLIDILYTWLDPRVRVR